MESAVRAVKFWDKARTSLLLTRFSDWTRGREFFLSSIRGEKEREKGEHKEKKRAIGYNQRLRSRISVSVALTLSSRDIMVARASAFVMFVRPLNLIVTRTHILN